MSIITGGPLGAPAASAAGGQYTSLSPARLADTRQGTTTIDNQFAGIGALAQGGSMDLTVLNRGGVPASGVDAVALNVTVTQPSASSFLTVYPTGDARPPTSNLNFTPNQTVPNMVIVKVGTGGKVSIFNLAGSTHVVVDVMGYFPTGGDFTGLAPARLADTRSGQDTTDHQVAGVGAIGQGGTLDVPVLNRGGVPASGVDAVVVNVTATVPTTAGFLTVYPTGQPRPNVSNLNFTAGQTVPNLVIAKVGTGGKISIFNLAGSTQVIVDVMGYLSSGGNFTALSPARLADTRSGQDTIDHQVAGTGAINGNDHLVLPVLNRGGVPASGVGAVVLNVTVTGPTASSFVTVYPGWNPHPQASNLNFVANQTVPNLVIAKVGDGGKVDLFNFAGSAHLVVDVLGWFPGSASTTDPTPVSVTGEGLNSCSLVSNGTVQCWGDNEFGQLGDGNVIGASSGDPLPDAVSGLTTASQVSAGLASTCATLTNHQVACWGDNQFGEAGFANNAGPFTGPVTVNTSAEGDVNSVAVGVGFACALKSGSTVDCWGDNSLGEGGTGSSVNIVQAPGTHASGITTATAITAGLSHACAVLADTTVKCWGDNTDGQIGNGSTTPNGVFTPTAVSGLTGVTSIAAGLDQTCAVVAAGAVKCWGSNSDGQLGNSGVTTLAATPVSVNGVSPATKVFAGFSGTCAIVSGGGVQCWGEGDNAVVSFPVTNVIDLSFGAGHICMLSSTNVVSCFGSNNHGQLGDGTFTDADEPVVTHIRP